MAYDAAHDSLVVYGGKLGLTFVQKGDTWVFGVAGPSILNHPADVQVCSGSAATFTASAIGTGLVGYQWRYEGIEIPGAVGPIYTIDPVQAGDAGAYDVVAFDLCGYGTSLPAILSITESGTGDGNGDGQTDGADIAGFVGAVLDEGSTPNSCAYDMDSDGSVSPSDVALFIEALLAT